MTLIMLFVSSVLLSVGMILLPPLTGTGLGALSARIWLGFGILVFYSHYLQYTIELEKKAVRQRATGLQATGHLRREYRHINAHPRLSDAHVNNLKRRSFSGQ